MRKLGTAMLVGWIALGAVGCRGHRAPVPSAESATALARDDRQGGRPRSMTNCPSSVQGAETSIKDRADGVELTITSQAPGGAVHIRDLARVQAAHLPQPPGTPLAHTARGTGGGALGHCPIVHVAGTMVSATEVEGGAKVIVTAKDPKLAAAVQRTAHARAAELPPATRVAAGP
jgi:hypothetical protein